MSGADQQALDLLQAPEVGHAHPYTQFRFAQCEDPVSRVGRDDVELMPAPVRRVIMLLVTEAGLPPSVSPSACGSAIR